MSWWLLPLLAGLGVAMIAAPLGCFVVWRRMAFFGDTLSHGALLGITLGLFFEIDTTLALALSSGLLAILLLQLDNRISIATDTLLGILSHSSLALGLVALSFFDNVRIDLMSYLFGDLLAVNEQDLTVIFMTAACVIGLIAWQWKGLLATTISPELAKIDGIPVERLKLLFVLMLAAVVAVAMKIVGVLLISALLIIPAATARPFSKSPQFMVLIAALIALLAVVGGMAASYQWDTPTGPSIVVAAAVLFLLSSFSPRKA